MNKISKEDIIEDAWAVKIALTDEEVEYCTKEVNKFFESRPELDCEDVQEGCVNLKALKYVNEDVINVFSSTEEKLVDVEELLSNAESREGNYVKVPKVL